PVRCPAGAHLSHASGHFQPDQSAGPGTGWTGGLHRQPGVVHLGRLRSAPSALAQSGLRRASASNVFLINIARVIGPTPPGFGVSHPATSSTPGPRSPTWRPSIQFVLTSTTAAPGFTMSLPIRLARPAAETRMSADRVWRARSFVLEWHSVTVALRLSSSSAAGLPTRLLRP